MTFEYKLTNLRDYNLVENGPKGASPLIRAMIETIFFMGYLLQFKLCGLVGIMIWLTLTGIEIYLGLVGIEIWVWSEWKSGVGWNGRREKRKLLSFPPAHTHLQRSEAFCLYPHNTLQRNFDSIVS